MEADGWSGEVRRGTWWWDEGSARAPKLRGDGQSPQEGRGGGRRQVRH